MTTIDVTTYSDDKSLGLEVPSIGGLIPVHGEEVKMEKSKIYVLYFFNTFYKGAYLVNEEMTVLSEKFPEVVFIAISNDAQQEKVEKYLSKEVVDLNTNEKIRLNIPHIFFDEGKTVAKRFIEAGSLAAMSCPAAYIISQKGKIAWRQEFLQTFTVKDSNFESQLKHVISGEKLESNGPRPIVADEGEEDETGEMSLF